MIGLFKRCFPTPVIPMSTDDSMSVIEEMYKVIKKLNEVIEAVNDLKTNVDDKLTTIDEWKTQLDNDFGDLKEDNETFKTETQEIVDRYTPPEFIAKTLASDEWDGNTQYLTITGLKNADYVIVQPAPGGETAWSNFDVKLYLRNQNILAFTCDTAPDTDINIRLIRWEM